MIQNAILITVMRKVEVQAHIHCSKKLKENRSGPDQTKTIEVLDILRCNLVVSDGAKHNVPDIFCWI